MSGLKTNANIKARYRLVGMREFSARRRGLILPVILIILLLLGLLSASYVLQIQADYSAGRSVAERLQCRLAAEAGIQKVMLMLRTDRDKVDSWYNNPDEFDQALVWSPSAEPEEIGEVDFFPEDETMAYRFSIVADDPTDDPADDVVQIRFGITDESSKLNINVATEAQLLKLITPLVPDEQNPLELVHALLDWRDEDDEAREFGAESEYYQSLKVPHRVKNAPFDTVEELLMVKGFNGKILYGEDYDRNGLLTENEDDGDIKFPDDNQDGELERGLYPYITVYSQEFNVANDNKPRINLFADQSTITEDLQEIFDQEIVDFIFGALRKEGTDKTNSLADLLKPRIVRNRLTESPITGADAITLFDKCTLDPTPQRMGLINVVTAPRKVLQCIDGLTGQNIDDIITKRATLEPAKKATTAWLWTEGVFKETEQYAAVQHQITARGRQFTIESIGFSDHKGLYSRLQVIVNMRGPMAQIVYYRDLTKLGLAYPIHGEEEERDLVLEKEAESPGD